MANELGVAWTEAAKEITMTVIKEDKWFTTHAAGTTRDTAVRESMDRVTRLYEAIYRQVRDSYRGKDSTTPETIAQRN